MQRKGATCPRPKGFPTIPFISAPTDKVVLFNQGNYKVRLLANKQTYMQHKDQAKKVEAHVLESHISLT